MFNNPRPRASDPVSAADFAELVRQVQRLGRSVHSGAMSDAAGAHHRPRSAASPLWAQILSYSAGAYSWREQRFDAAAGSFTDKSGGREGSAFEASGSSDVASGAVVRLHRVDGGCYVFQRPGSGNGGGEVVSVVTDVACNFDGTITVTRQDILAQPVGE